MYTQDDINNIKIFKHIQNRSLELGRDINGENCMLDSRIGESESILKHLGYDVSKINKHNNHKDLTLNVPYSQKSYNEILDEAEKSLGTETIYGFEDLLSSSEINNACKRVDEINTIFSKKTSLDKTDLCFLILATAFQTIKWIMLPAIGESFNPDERMPHDDDSIKKEHKGTLDDFKDDHYEKNGNSESTFWKPKKDDTHRKSWIEILYTKAPYDKIQGSASLGLGLCGTNHRLKTLGHDPILGWIFGTANFMTDTATLINFESYRIKQAKFSGEIVLLPQLFQECIDLTRFDWHCLAAALVAQGAHIKSDQYTKMGLPVPILTTLSEDWASSLYFENYDYLCFQRDLKTITMSSLTSIFINMIISFVHGMFYNPSIHGTNKDFYEIKTRKILLISNGLATTSNLITCYLTKNPHKLDIGGLLVTLSRLFMDIRFITRIKEEFIQNELDKDLNNTLEELDKLYR